MYELVEYNKKYEEQLIKLWIDVCVEEFGFEEWRDGMSKVEEELYEKIWIAVIDNQVVGSIAYIDKGDNIAEIKRVYVYAEHRGTGISQQFMELLIDELEEKGYEKVVLETWSKFNRGINFYIKNKFQLVEQDGECYKYERFIYGIDNKSNII